MTLAEQRAFTMSALGGAVRQTAPSAHHESSARSVRTGASRTPTRTGTGWSITPQLYLMQGLVASEIETSSSSRPARSRPHSTWTRSCGRCRPTSNASRVRIPGGRCVRRELFNYFEGALTGASVASVHGRHEPMTQNTSVPRQTSAVQKLFACLDYLLGVDRLLILLASLGSRIDL